MSDKDEIRTNTVHSELRWTTEGYEGPDGTVEPPKECFKTTDETRTNIGEGYINGCDGGLWFSVIRVESRHWWHHSDKEDPGFRVSHELEIGASSYGIGFHTTIPIISDNILDALSSAVDVIRKDREAQREAGRQVTDYRP